MARYEELSGRMDALARAMPGSISTKSYAADDGDRISVVCFESHDALAAWRHLPAHVEAQQIGRTSIYAGYTVQVCEVTRAYGFPVKDS